MWYSGFLALEWPLPFSENPLISPVDEGVISPHGSDILDEEGIVAGPQQPGRGASGDHETSSEREVL